MLGYMYDTEWCMTDENRAVLQASLVPVHKVRAVQVVKITSSMVLRRALFPALSMWCGQHLADAAPAPNIVLMVIDEYVAVVP